MNHQHFRNLAAACAFVLRWKSISLQSSIREQTNEVAEAKNSRQHQARQKAAVLFTAFFLQKLHDTAALV